MKKKLLAVLLTLCLVLGLFPIGALAAPVNPGDVEATKTATYNAGNDEVTITLRVQGKDVTETETKDKPVDVVLVVDNSGSMDDNQERCTSKSYEDAFFGKRCTVCGTYYFLGLGTWNTCLGYISKMSAAKAAAYTLMDSLQKASEDNRIAIVAFEGSSGGIKESELVGNACVSLTPVNTEDNVKQINNAISEMRANGGTNYTAGLSKAQSYLADSDRETYVIFISDGNPGKKGTSAGNKNWNGVAQAEALKENGTKIYTIGLGLGEDEAMSRLATPNTDDITYAYNFTNLDNINQELSNLVGIIGTQITTVNKPAGTNAQFVDVVSDQFTVDVQTVEGLTFNGNRVTWDVRTITEESKTVSFTVTPKPGVYGTVDTNVSATITYTDASGASKSTSVANAQVTMPSSTLTYNANGGQNAPAEVTVRSGEQVTVSEVIPTKVGFNFAGWKDANNHIYQTGDTVTLSEDIELIAQWTLIEKTIEVNLNSGDGTWADGSNSTKYITLSSLTPDKEETLPAVVAPDADKEFDKWTNSLDSSTLSENASISYNQMAAIIGEFEEIGYIGWTAQYKDIPAPAMVTFTYMAGKNGSLKGAVSEEVSVFSPKGAFPTNVPTPVANEGYKFAGWQIGESPVGEVTLLSSEELKTMPFAQNTTFVAVFEEDPEAGKTLRIHWAIDNADAASWELYDGNARTETIAWSDRDNTFVMPKVVVKDGYHLAGWSVSGARGEYWDADTQTFDLDGLIVEDDEGGYVSITANIVSDEPEDPNAGKTLKIYWGIDNPDAASWKLFDNSSWTETIAWSDRGNTFVMPEVVVKEGYHLAGWSVSGARGEYWDADTQTFDLDGLIVEDDEGGYVSITANIVKDVPATYTVTLVNEGRYAYGEGSYKAGETVTVYAGTKVGYSFDKWTSGDISITRPYSSKITFTMPAHDVVVKANWDRAGSVLPSLPDVPDDTTPNWLNLDDHDAYIQGYPDGFVKPQNNITRAEVATIFYRLLTDEAREYFWSNDSGFSDVKPGDWFNTAVSTMVNAGVITGYNDGTFRPNDPITRAEFATIAARFLSDPYSLQDQFYDTEGHWAEVYINRAAEVGWINGYNDGSFRPNQAITRAEAVTLVNNVLGRAPHADYMLDDMVTWPDNPKSAWFYEDIQEATNSHDYRWSSGKRYEIWTSLN